ncbi:hypothetical protein ABBQ32_005053 [Trebouxia sp. C0010 RCD-2024]
MLVGSPPHSPVMNPHRQSDSHRMSPVYLPCSPNQTPEGEVTQAALLPLLDAADYINEPAGFQVACSESPSISVAASMYMNCLQPWASQAPSDFVIHTCQPLLTTSDPQESTHHDPPEASHHDSRPPASSGVPLPSHDSHHQQPHAQQQMLLQPLHSVPTQQPASNLPSFEHQSPEMHITFSTQQSATHTSGDATHQQMSHDLHRSGWTHKPCDNNPSALVYSGEPAMDVPYTSVQAGRTADNPSGEEQGYATAGPAATTGAAIGLNEGLWPVCQSSISPDSR